MTECKYCGLVENKKNLLYEDDSLVAIVPEKPTTKGHIMVVSKKHHTKIQDIDDKELQHLFYAASFGATALFENLEAHGTNIIFNTGSTIQEGGHFHIDVLARKSGDELNFLWKPKKLPDPEMDEVQARIKDKCDMIGVEKKEKEVIDLDKKKPEKIESEEEKAPQEGKEEEEEKKELPSEEEQRYKKVEKKDEEPEDKESYLIKQLRRVP
ncbi:HIT family protein [Candidatus Woesearchaeota archaeon]|jgi:diadenosine tetraphosphate (Ap4A) HIT family hydrolase|nr:HIT family protein [Candidatus Woesearchaeota archaeon]